MPRGSRRRHRPRVPGTRPLKPYTSGTGLPTPRPRESFIDRQAKSRETQHNVKRRIILFLVVVAVLFALQWGSRLAYTSYMQRQYEQTEELAQALEADLQQVLIQKDDNTGEPSASTGVISTIATDIDSILCLAYLADEQLPDVDRIVDAFRQNHSDVTVTVNIIPRISFSDFDIDSDMDSTRDP